MVEDSTKTKDFYQLVQTRDAIEQLRQAIDRLEEALERGDWRDAETWRLQARPRMKAVQSWSRAAAGVLAEESKHSST